MTPDERYIKLHAECLELVFTLRDRIYTFPDSEVDWPEVVVMALLKRHLEDAASLVTEESCLHSSPE